MDGKYLQENFLNKIKALVPTEISFVDILSELLNLSNDSIYRRLRNETYLSVEEIAILCKHFKVSFDVDATISPDNVTFLYKSLKGSEDFKFYLKRILFDLNDISKSTPKRIFYTANDIPIFHHFQSKELAAFKVFYWLKGVMNDPELKDKKFDVSLIDPEILDLGKQIYNFYCSIPSVEIWTTETINTTVEQVHYYWESGLFMSKEDALLICEQILNELSVLKLQADCGFKELDIQKRSDNHNFMLYQSEIEIGNNTIMIEKGTARSIYISCHTLNYLFTTQSNYCTETKEWIDNLIGKSILISKVSEKQRYKFFKVMTDKILSLKQQIEHD